MASTMATDSDPAVTRVTIILDKPEDWFTWLFIRKDVANDHGIWQYIDPDVTKENLPTLTENPEPQLADYKVGATRLYDLSAEDRESYRWEFNLWERKNAKYCTQKKALSKLNTDIGKTISPRHIHLILNKDTPYDRLVALKKFLCPTDATRRRELADKYNALKIAPRAAKKVEQWLSDWTYITTQGKTIKLPETEDNRPQEDFLIACKALDQEYATSCLREIFKHEARGTTKEISSLETYVTEMTAYLRRTKPHSTGLAVSAAELGIANTEAPRPTECNGGCSSRNDAQTHICICGKKHRYCNCFILNTRHPKRPKDYQPSDEAVRKVNEALKNPKLKAIIKKALDKWAAHQPQSVGTLRIDDGKPPADTNTFVVSINSSPTTLSSPNLCDPCDKDNKDNDQNDYNDRDIITIDGHIEPAEHLTAMAVDNDNQAGLLNRWIVDPGSNTHVINTESWQGWKRTGDNPERRYISAGNGRTLITAWGTMELIARTPRGPQMLELTHVAYVEGFLTSILGLARCRTESIHFDSGRDILYMHRSSNVIAQLEYNGGHWLIDADPSRRPPMSSLSSHLSTFGASYRPSYAPKPANVVERRTAHQIWGHPGRETVDHLESNVTGVQLTGEHMDCMCQTCVEAHMTHIISRRPAESRAVRPFYRIAIDIIYIVPMGEECIDGSKYGIHSIDEYSKWHEIATPKRKDKQTLIRWFMALVRKIQRTYNTDVVAVRCDNERGFGNDLINTTEELGMLYEPAPPGTKEPNGLIERAGGVVTRRARAMRIHANLPKSLSHELYHTAVYILNRTPTEALGWKTPYEIVWGRKPLVAHMRPIGCRAYVYNRDLKVADKLESRVLIGHLVGYQGTNIFRIWLPTKDTVIVTRDVVFEPTLFFSGMDGYATQSELEGVIELLEYPDISPDDDISIEDLLTARQRRQSMETPATSATRTAGSQLGGEMTDDTFLSTRQQQQLLTPGPSEKGSSPTVPMGYRQRGEKAPHDVNLDPNDTSLILTGKRNRRQKDLNNFAIHAYAARLGPELLVDYLRAFSTEIPSIPTRLDEVPRIYQSQLPPLPKSAKKLDGHMFGSQFRRAMEAEWQDLRAKDVFGKTTKTKATADGEVLPLKWVFTYKTDGDGYLSRFKARLVVRGDLQSPLDNTYAATLAIRNFRALIAIANYFDLELKQYDVPTAFLNAKIDRTVYAETPESFRHIEGEIMRILRALYGLKESPLLWYNELRRELIKLGLKPVEGFPCLYSNSWLILFVYVDDIVMAFHESNAELHKSFETDLVNLYNTKAIGDLTWFLGIRIVRDRALRKTWLVQDAFIDKVCSRFGIETVGRTPDVPLTENWLPQSTEEPDAARTKLYQQLVGSLAYIAIWGRPDVARTHVVYACHLTNPGESHVSKIRQTWRYLLGTKTLALEASANIQDTVEYLSDDPLYRDPLFFGSSDASYADEPETRRSSQGYAFKFGGLMIDWKSTVQRTVTKSTTESELLSLSVAASQMEEWMRFFAGINLTLDHKPTIWCDNQQTVGIVTKQHDKLHTKVKHVDIHQLWIRQEVTASRINVKWVPTDRMPADGLTKILPKQKFMEFIRQLGLVDIAKRLKGLKCVDMDNVDSIYPNLI